MSSVHALTKSVLSLAIVKVRQNDFFSPILLPKKELTNSTLSYETSGQLVFIHFLEEIEDTKKTF